MNRIIERGYRALLGLYPAAFRAAYGDEMAQVFRDELIRRAGARRWAWLAFALGDLLMSAACERLAEWRKHPLRTAWGGLSLAVAGACWLWLRWQARDVLVPRLQ